MTTEPVAREWVERRERVWEAVRKDSGLGSLASCYERGGECVCHISSAGRRRCVVCRAFLLGDIAEGAYVDSDAAQAALAATVAADGGPCWRWPRGRCNLGARGALLPDGETMACAVCGCTWRKVGKEMTPDWQEEEVTQ